MLWNADYPTGKGKAWRRYTSSDLVNWVDHGVSIPKYTTSYGSCQTGSSVADVINTAGYGAGSVIALLTMSCENLGGQSTALWYSTDGGASFQFGAIIQTNPLAGATTVSDRTFRDSNVFWHTPSGRWVMSLAEIGKLSIYTSADLKRWIYRSAMSRNDLGTMECPNLIRLHLYDVDGTTRGDRWVMLCGANGTAQGFTSGTHYWVGQFDGVTYTPDSWEGQWLDAGPDCYATTVFADANAVDPLAYAFAISWQNNWHYVKLMKWMHWPVPEQGSWLQPVVRGYFAYHAVPGNWKALGTFRTQCTRLWYRTLRRRSQKSRLTWDRMTQIADAWLPPARILHPWPEQRLAALIQGKSRMQ